MVENQLKLRFLVYLSRIIYSTYNPFCFVLYMYMNYCDICKQKQTRKIRVVDSTTLNQIVQKSPVCDINNSVIVDDIQIVKTYGNFAVICIEDNLGNITKRRANVIAVNLKGAHDVLVTTNLFHNLKGCETCTLRKSYDNTLKFADEVDLSLINSSTDFGNFIIDEILKNYFKSPKLLYAGDIIEIDFESYGKEMFYFSDKISHICKKVYFKCNKVLYRSRSVNGYYCMIGETNLKQSANVQSFIPRTFQEDSERFGEISSCPYGLQNHFTSIKKAVQPFISQKNLHFQPVFLLEGRKGSGKQLLVKCIASYFGMHLYSVNNFDLTANVYAQNETKLRNVFFSTKMAAPSILELRNFENFGKNNEGQYDERLINHFTDELANFFANTDFPLVVFCCTNEKHIPVELKRVFLKKFEIKAPNEREREENLKWIFKSLNIKTSINFNSIANKTHGFLLEDLKALVEYAVNCFSKENSDEVVSEKYVLRALDFMQSNYNESLGAPKVPKVLWSDVGGLGDVKDEIIKTIKLPLKHPELLKSTGLKRSGILLFGPPGTGKTLIAKAVATECGLCFLSVKGPELLNMYVGQSEQNVREVFERAREASPCIIFFDELDSLAPNRGASGDSGGVMDRVVSQLLAEMDGLNDTATIFIIGATNRPDLIDPALLRPGRFDKLLYIGPCADKPSKTSVLEALTKKFIFENENVLEETVDLCPENFSGADFYGVCSNAWMSAVRRLIIDLENGSVRRDVTVDDVIVGLDDFKQAIRSVKPSIKKEDLEYFNKLKTELGTN